MKAPKFHGVCDKDMKVHLDAPKAFAAYKQTLRGQRITLTIEKYRRKATSRQHGYYSGVALPMIAEAMGHEVYEYPAVHDALMRELFGLKPDCDPRLKIRVSTADMDTVEFTDKMIETVQRWAAHTLGLVIPDPDPEYKHKAKKQRAA